MTTSIDFLQVLKAESGLIVARREARARRTDPGADPGPLAITVEQMTDGGELVWDERQHPFPKMSSDHDLVGLALSGGGVRSASFCLGVLQGLDAVVPDDTRPQILDAVDYLSTVSGGGYIGGSLVSGMLQAEGRFPFSSKFDQMETFGTQHLRDHSNYLAPTGGLDWVVGAVVLLRGFLINALLVAGLVFLACAVTVAIYADEGHLGGDWVPGLGWVPIPFAWTGIVVTAFIGVQLPWIAQHIGLLPSASSTLGDRERVGTRLAYLLLFCVGVASLDFQSFVLRGLFDAVHLSLCRSAAAGAHPAECAALQQQAGWLGMALSRVGLGAGAPWASLATAVAALGAFGTKLVKVAGATFGDRSWSGILKHWGSRVAIALGSLVVPLALWAVYLSLCFAAIQIIGGESPPACCGLPVDPDRIAGSARYGLPLAGAALGALFLIACCFLPANANSLHGYYRDRLSRAFLWTAPPPAAEAPNPGEAPAHTARTAPVVPDRIALSHLAFRPMPGGGAGPDVEVSVPYLIINTAVNLEGSRYANRRGRNADSFILSPLYSGSEATGYVATSELQRRDPHLDLATAMAISGAAASANMGASTIRPLTFSLAVLNVRLGYWLPNPKRLPAWRASFLARLERAWPLSFAREAAGRLDEDSPMVYLTDGGHFDNLGVYELLKRRCKVVIAVDAEADPPMNFESLIRLERCARIDLGVRIDLPWEALRRWSREVTVDAPHGPDDDLTDCVGPHVAVGRIQYSETDVGVLIYIKSCITGDENDLIRDYRRRNPDFPHETTLDQFFTEEQFEVYRALGFHAARSFFTGQDRFGFSPAHPDAAWRDKLTSALRRLDVPPAAIAAIVAQQDRAPVPPPPRRAVWLEGLAGRGVS